MIVSAEDLCEKRKKICSGKNLLDFLEDDWNVSVLLSLVMDCLFRGIIVCINFVFHRKP